MKTTNKILIASVLGIVLILVGMLVAARTMLGSFVSFTGEAIEPDGVIEERNYDVSGFSRIQLDGGFEVDITQGSSHHVSLEADTAVLDVMEVSVDNETLTISPTGPFAFRNMHAVLTIETPDLRSIAVDGGSKIRLNNIESSELRVESHGAADISSTGGGIERLSIQSDGAGRFDFTGTPSTDADLVLNGVGQILVNMAGGVLSGAINGAGSIEYSGELRDRRVQVNGVGSVERAD